VSGLSLREDGKREKNQGIENHFFQSLKSNVAYEGTQKI